MQDDEKTIPAPDAPDTNLDAILRKVSALLTRAEHSGTPKPEADLCYAKAQEMMARYRIEEAMLVETGRVSMTPVHKTWIVCEAWTEFRDEQAQIMRACANHVDVRFAWSYGPDPDNEGRYSLIADLTGFDSDVRFSVALFATIKLQFLTRLVNEVDPTLSDEENVYNLRSAGIERWKIAEMMGWGKATGKVTRIYAKACEARGEVALVSGRSVSAKKFRAAFAEAYALRISMRFRQQRSEDEGALVLASRKAAVDEAFYERHPDQRPIEPTAEDYARWAKEAAKPVRQRKVRKLTVGELTGRAAGRAAADAANITKPGTASARKVGA